MKTFLESEAGGPVRSFEQINKEYVKSCIPKHLTRVHSSVSSRQKPRFWDELAQTLRQISF